MRPLSFFSIFLLAAPSIGVPTSLSPRQCVTEYPTYQGSINKGEPNSPSTNGPSFVVWKETNGTVVESLIQFTNIPTDAWGCQLEVFFPRGYPSLFPMYGGRNQMYVYRVMETVQPGASWNSAPKSAYLFGSTPGELPTTQPVQNDIKFVINSAACTPTMGFRVTIAPEVERGGVQFWKDSVWNTVGFRMMHNC